MSLTNGRYSLFPVVFLSDFVLFTEQIWAPSPSTERGLPTQLSSDPKGEKLAYAVNTSLELVDE